MQRDPLSLRKALRVEGRADEKSGDQVITIKPSLGLRVPVERRRAQQWGVRNAPGGAQLLSSTTDAVLREKWM